MFISDGKKIVDARGAVIEKAIHEGGRVTSKKFWITYDGQFAFTFETENVMNRAFDLIIEAMEGAQPYVSIEGLTV